MRPQSTFSIDAQLRRISATQLGLITVEQARKFGVDRHALARRRESGALVRVFGDVMCMPQVASTPAQRVLAASLAVPGSTIAATSAAAVFDMPIPPGQTGEKVVLSVGGSRIVRISGITVVRQTTTWPSRTWMTTRVATPAAAIVLLPRFVDDFTVERCLDHCLARRLTSVATMRALIERLPRQSVFKRALLRDLLADRGSGIGHRSGLEQRVARWLARAGLRGWTRNFRVNVDDGQTVEVDFGWDAISVALEVSPFFTHGSRAKQERDAQRRRLLVRRGWQVVEAVDSDVVNERTFASTIATLRALGAT